jgi:hypothetical protein
VPTGCHFQQEANLDRLFWNDGRRISQKTGLHERLATVKLRRNRQRRKKQKSKRQSESENNHHTSF